MFHTGALLHTQRVRSFQAGSCKILFQRTASLLLIRVNWMPESKPEAESTSALSFTRARGRHSDILSSGVAEAPRTPFCNFPATSQLITHTRPPLSKYFNL
jgi:hypothetical protein